MKISELAKSTQVGIETVRFYERKGLLPAPKRRESGYREYGDRDVVRVRFIRRVQALGFSLKEIRELLGLNVGEGATCGQMAPRAETKLAELDEKIRDLKKVRASLARLMKACGGQNGRAACDCRVVDCFEEGKCE